MKLTTAGIAINLLKTKRKLNTEGQFYINNFFSLGLGFYKILLRLSYSIVNLFLKF